MVAYSRNCAYVSSESVSSVVQTKDAILIIINGKELLVPIDRTYKMAGGRFLCVEGHIRIKEARVDVSVRLMKENKADITAKATSDSIGSQDFHKLFLF